MGSNNQNSNGEKSTDKCLKHAFHKEWSANKAVRCTDQTHDCNLTTASINSKANGVVNKDKGNKHQKSNKADSADTNVCCYAKQALNGLTTILNITRWIALIIRNCCKR